MAPTVLIAQAPSSASPADSVQHGVVVSDASAAGAHTASEGHAEAVVFPPFDPTHFASQLLWFALAFGALYVLMSRVALPQIGSIIDTRKGRIDGDLKEAERLKGETDKALTAYQEALAAARSNARAIAEETRLANKADLDGKRKAIEDDLGKRVAEAEGRIQADKTAALTRVGEIASETAAAVVRQLSGDVSAADVSRAVADVVKG
ncbi:MAG: F0F1 ATP synthase subunit B [Devosia sp.]